MQPGNKTDSAPKPQETHIDEVTIENRKLSRQNGQLETESNDTGPAFDCNTELADILQDHPLVDFHEDELPELPVNKLDLSKMHTELLEKIVEQQYSKAAVDEAFHTILIEMRKNHTLSVQLDERLKSKDTKLRYIIDMYKTDPRVAKVLKVAVFWREQAEKAEQTNNDLLQQLENLQMDLESMTQALQHNRNIITRISKENNACKEDRVTLDMLQIKSAQQNQEIHVCTEMRKDFKEQVAQLKEKLHGQADLIKDLTKAAQIASNFELKLHALDAAKQKVEHKYDELIYNYKKSEKIWESHLSQMEVVVNNIWDLQCKNRSMEKVVNQLKSQLAKSLNRLEARKVREDKLNKEVNRQIWEITGVNNKLRTKEAELQLAKVNISSLQNTIVKLRHSNRHTNQQFQECNIHNRLVGVELDVLKNENSKLQTRNDDYLSKIGNMDRYLKNKDEYIRVINDEMGSARHKALILLNNIEDVVAESVRLQQKNSILYQFGMDMKERWIAYNEKYEEQKKITSEKESKVMNMLVQIQNLGRGFNRLNDTLLKSQSRNHYLASEARRQIEDMRSMHRTLHFSAAEIKTFSGKYDVAQKQAQKLALLDVRNNARINNLETECNSQREKISAMVAQIREERSYLEYFMREVNHIGELLKFEIFRTKEFQMQRDIMGARVVHARAKEQLLLEKARVMEQIISRGKRACTISNNDIIILKKEVKKQRYELANLKSVLEDNKNLKDELIKCRKDLILEENKRTAASNLIEPRLHPNRLLKAIFPSKYEMLLKNQKLVKCFIRKVDENISKEQEIIGLKKDLMTVKVLLQNRGNSDVATDIIAIRADVRRKNKQIKSLMAELNCATSDLSAARATADSVTQDFMAFKDKINKGVYLPRSLSRPRPVSSLPPIEPNKEFNVKRKMGGGFVMNDTPKPNEKKSILKQQNRNNNTLISDETKNRIIPVDITKPKKYQKSHIMSYRNPYKKNTSLSSTERMMKSAAVKNLRQKSITESGKSNEVPVGKIDGQIISRELCEKVCCLDKNNGNSTCNTSVDSKGSVIFDELTDNFKQKDDCAILHKYVTLTPVKDTSTAKDLKTYQIEIIGANNSDDSYNKNRVVNINGDRSINTRKKKRIIVNTNIDSNDQTITTNDDDDGDLERMNVVNDNDDDVNQNKMATFQDHTCYDSKSDNNTVDKNADTPEARSGRQWEESSRNGAESSREVDSRREIRNLIIMPDLESPSPVLSLHPNDDYITWLGADSESDSDADFHENSDSDVEMSVKDLANVDEPATERETLLLPVIG